MGYTGQYGMVLLRGLSQMFALLAATDVDVSASREDLYRAVDETFAPVIFDYQLLDSTRGRGIRSHDAG